MKKIIFDKLKYIKDIFYKIKNYLNKLNIQKGTKE